MRTHPLCDEPGIRPLWQWWHYQRQNVGMVALSRVSFRVGSLTARERNTILVAGSSGSSVSASLPQSYSSRTSWQPRSVSPSGSYSTESTGALSGDARQMTKERYLCVLDVEVAETLATTSDQLTP
jgi:hypothetical protein